MTTVEFMKLKTTVTNVTDVKVILFATCKKFTIVNS